VLDPTLRSMRRSHVSTTQSGAYETKGDATPRRARMVGEMATAMGLGGQSIGGDCQVDRETCQLLY
jgi:hypothetical protein